MDELYTLLRHLADIPAGRATVEVTRTGDNEFTIAKTSDDGDTEAGWKITAQPL